MKTALLIALCSLSLACCTTNRLVAEAEAPATSRSSSVSLDSLAQLPAYLVPAPAGSSPRQRRQWQKAQAANLARAGHAPAKVKLHKSTVAAGAGAVAISKPQAPVATGAGSTATDARKQGQRGGAGAVGPDASATATTKSGLSYWWLLVPAVGLLYWQRKRLLAIML
ncbi:hypothetical protein [uncultured Hymenobacter sp.]|uniref:hypothetical protein n=1 Tax=uncultured Hymenobacter sp. TaxID=170016 RepID=UPI0035CB4C6E